MVSAIQKARFRIEVYDMVAKKTRSKSFIDGDNATADSLIAMIEHCISNKEYRQFANVSLQSASKNIKKKAA